MAEKTMAEKWYKVEVALEDTASPGAPHAYGPVVLTFKTSGDDLVQDAVSTLIGRAAASRGTPSDIEAWARKLADDSGDLND
jgi:hypothetical protein